MCMSNYDKEKTLENMDLSPFSYEEHGDTVYITGYTSGDCRRDVLVIPNSIGGKKVKGIGPRAFEKSNVRIVLCLNNLEVIEEEAFLESKLEAIHFARQMERIGANCFKGCKNLRELQFPEQLTDELEAGICLECVSLINVYLPDNVSEIPPKAFCRCRSLKNISLPDAVLKIGHSAFEGCGSLENIDIKDKVRTISESAFEDCVCLRDISLPSNIRYIEKRSFANCIRLSTVKFPDTLESIGREAFLSCKQLDDINLHLSRIKYIEPRTFAGCSSLSHIDLPEDLTTIKEGAFEGCINLEYLKLNDKLNKIEQNAFAPHRNLTIEVGGSAKDKYPWMQERFWDTLIESPVHDIEPPHFNRYVTYGREDEVVFLNKGKKIEIVDRNGRIHNFPGIKNKELIKKLINANQIEPVVRYRTIFIKKNNAKWQVRWQLSPDTLYWGEHDGVPYSEEVTLFSYLNDEGIFESPFKLFSVNGQRIEDADAEELNTRLLKENLNYDDLETQILKYMLELARVAKCKQNKKFLLKIPAQINYIEIGLTYSWKQFTFTAGIKRPFSDVCVEYCKITNEVEDIKKYLLNPESLKTVTDWIWNRFQTL